MKTGDHRRVVQGRTERGPHDREKGYQVDTARMADGPSWMGQTHRQEYGGDVRSYTYAI